MGGRGRAGGELVDVSGREEQERTPSSGDVFCHEAGVILLRKRHACQAEVAHLEVAVTVEEQVGWLEVAVEHMRRVDVP